MTVNEADLSVRLLPQPQQMVVKPGTFRLTDGIGLYEPHNLESPEHEALGRFCDACATDARVRLERRPFETAPPPGSIIARLANDGEPPPTATAPDCLAQGYRLRIGPDGVELVGFSPVGLFNGIQTLMQLPAACGSDWPLLEIEDVPDFAFRGLSYDVSRGKVPRLDTLKELVDRLASLKANQLQLYVEHTFAFAFNPDISRGSSPLTADDIRELDAYAAQRRVALVPSLASFGHMGAVLSLPEYRHLAEAETTKSWSELTWGQRMYGLTLDVSNPESRRLLEQMYGEYLPLFSSNLANVSCDETYDLGKTKNKDRVEREGLGKLYLEHVRWLGELCARHGKRMMFWSDMIRKHPELITEIPRDAVVLDWAYHADADYEGMAPFREAGLCAYACPGTSGWNRFVNNFNNADLNIRRWAEAGKRHGAAGLLNTDWGDEGHINLLACAWHPIYLGAAMAWNAAKPSPDEFDAAFGRLALGADDARLIGLLRRVAAASNTPRVWPIFYAPLTEAIPEAEIAADQVTEWQSASREAAERLAAHAVTDERRRQDIRELEIACRLNALVADRIALSRRLAGGAAGGGRLADDLERFAAACEAAVPEFESVWLARNRPSLLHEVTAVFHRLATEARAAGAT